VTTLTDLRGRDSKSCTEHDPHELLYRVKHDLSALVDVPVARFLMIDGSGSPEGKEFQQAVGALHAVAYTAKFALKKAGGPDVEIPPPEGLYTADETLGGFTAAARDRLVWTLLLRLLDPIEDPWVVQARIEVAERRELAALDRVRVERFDEGLSAQVLHVGPYSTEGPTMERLHAFIRAQARTPRGRHHEIYLSDPSSAKPDRRRTILRQPVT
jgi:hypothetical protein